MTLAPRLRMRRALAHTFAVFALACSTSEGTPDAHARPAEAMAVASTPDAGMAAVADAGTLPSQGASDAARPAEGANLDATPAPAPLPEVAAASPAPEPIGPPPLTKETLFDRVLVKPKEKGLSADVVSALAQEATGKKVVFIRRTAGTFFLLVFEASRPPRDAQAQSQLVKALKQRPEIAAAEGDRLMSIK